LSSFTLLLALLGAPRVARADDAAVIAQVNGIMRDDFANANFGEAKKKLRALLGQCGKRPQCGSSAMAEIHLALGMVAAQIGRDDEARQSFTDALNDDPAASPPATGLTDAIKTRFQEAHKAWIAAHPQPDDATKAGFTNKVAYDFAAQATQADQTGNYPECIQKDRAALQIEEQPRARLHLATCEQKAGKIIDALRDSQKALEGATQRKDSIVMKAAQVKLADLLPKISHVEFTVPPGVGGLKVTFDERAIPSEKLGQSFSIDPGQHHAHAEGSVSGILMTFDQTVDVKEGETAKVEIRLKPTALTPGQLECMLKAKSEEEIKACFPKEEKPLIVRAGMDVGVYNDSTSVQVLSPMFRGAVISPTGGWNVGASYTIDVLTAASPDVVATASRRFDDTRHAVTGTAGYKPGRYGGQLSAFGSSEKDYFSRGVNAVVSGDFYEKQLTPSLGFGYSLDTIGRGTTPFNVFSQKLTTVEITAGATIVASPVALLVLGATVQLERGDQSKPYRWIPMFDQGVTVPVGASISQVNATRLAFRPIEHLPTERDRYALAARYALRMGSLATLRLEERLYTDSWSIRASTTDLRYMLELSRRLTVWPHGHLHAQTAAAFYQRVYNVICTGTCVNGGNVDGSIDLPANRTTDRELSPFLSVTGGGGFRYALTPPDSKVQVGVSLLGDAMYSRYFNALFIKQRLAEYGTIGVDGEFE
jgi:tetratricopeptide (TPR) repeat protein